MLLVKDQSTLCRIEPDVVAPSAKILLSFVFQDRGMNLKLVIDLSNTDRYYSPNVSNF